jgi:hypothetical protein
VVVGVVMVVGTRDDDASTSVSDVDDDFVFVGSVGDVIITFSNVTCCEPFADAPES